MTVDYTCLLCNHFLNITQPCSECGRPLENLGLLQDFYDPYSPYLDQEIYYDNYKNYNENYCVHIMRCNACDKESVHAFKRLTENELH